MMSLVGKIISHVKQTLAERKFMNTLTDLDTALAKAQTSLANAKTAKARLATLVTAPPAPIDYTSRVNAINQIAADADELTTDLGGLAATLGG